MTTPETLKSDLSLIYKAYAASLESDDRAHLANALGLSQIDTDSLLETWPPFAEAVSVARAKRNMGVLGEFVDEETRQAWEVLRDLDSVDAKQRELMHLASGGDLAKQKLFVHAMTETYFNLPRVCKALGIGKKTLDNWAKNSPEFAAMLDGIRWAKAGFVESQLFGLVALGSEKAIIHANEGLNREQYGKAIEVKGTVEHNHTVGLIDLTQIDLPMETRIGLIKAIRDAGLLDVDFMLVGEEETPATPRLSHVL